MIGLANIKSLGLLIWGGVNAGLVMGIGGELEWGKNLELPISIPTAHQSEPVLITLPPDYRLPVREKSYAETLGRPLFVPTRRVSPPAPPPPPPPPPTMQKGQFLLMGTILTDELKIAVVREISSGKERQVVQGYTINGLQLEQVEPNRIVFTQYNDKEEIRLKTLASSKSTSTPVGGHLAKSPVAATSVVQPGFQPGRLRGQDNSSGRVERPAPIVVPPQTVEDRARDPLFKDFYKK